MNSKRIAVAALVLLFASAVAPAAAVGQSDTVDECQNADNGPSGDAGPPGFVSDLAGGAAESLGDLFSTLPVPNFVKGFFGASTC